MNTRTSRKNTQSNVLQLVRNNTPSCANALFEVASDVIADRSVTGVLVIVKHAYGDNDYAVHSVGTMKSAPDQVYALNRVVASLL